jgi:hypothetical protein
VFASGPVKASSLPHGWSTLPDAGTENAEPRMESEELSTQNSDPAMQGEGLGTQNTERVPAEDPDDSFFNVEPAVLAKAKRGRRKPAAAAPVEPAKRARKTTAKPAVAKARTPSRRTPRGGSTGRGAGAADRGGRDDGNR